MTEPMTGSPAPRSANPELEIDYADQRRWTVLIRILLAIPQMVALVFVGLAAAAVAVVGWFAALATGRLPAWAAEFLSGYLGWQTRFTAYVQLTVDRYPPFAFTAPDDYPARIALPAPGELNRAAVLFRFILLIPAVVISSVVSYGWSALGLVIWLVVLISGRMPTSLFLATGAVVRYALRYQAYGLMLTSAYPKRLFGDVGETVGETEPPLGPPATRPLSLTSAARVWLVVFIVCGVLGYSAQAGASAAQQANQAGPTTAISER